MDARFPFQVASWWAGMALGIPMLAAELAGDIWRPDPPKPAPVPASPGMNREVAEIRTRFSTDGVEEVLNQAKAARGAKLAKSSDPLTRLTGERMVAKAMAKAKRARKRKAT